MEKTPQEIINETCTEWFNEEVTIKNALIKVWNAALDMASVFATMEHHPTTGNLHIDKQSITDLKIIER